MKSQKMGVQDTSDGYRERECSRTMLEPLCGLSIFFVQNTVSGRGKGGGEEGGVKFRFKTELCSGQKKKITTKRGKCSLYSTRYDHA